MELVNINYTTNAGYNVKVALTLSSDVKRYELSIQNTDNICASEYRFLYNFHSLRRTDSLQLLSLIWASPTLTKEYGEGYEDVPLNDLITIDEVDYLFNSLLNEVINNESRRMKEMYNKNTLSKIYSKTIGDINHLDDETISEYTRYIINSNSKDRIKKIVKKRKAGSDEKSKQRS